MWQFVSERGAACTFDAVAINPTVVLGPVLTLTRTFRTLTLTLTNPTLTLTLTLAKLTLTLSRRLSC